MKLETRPDRLLSLVEVHPVVRSDFEKQKVRESC
jgi:hypothetical protein